MGKILKELCRLNEIPLSDKDIEKFDKYRELLKKWGKRINITSLLTDEEIEKKHFFDSLTGIKAFEKKNIDLKGKKVADVGSGGGFPGIPLAILNPETTLTLIEPRHKRAVFLEQVKRELKLPNIEVICDRIENIEDKNFDILTMRAVKDPETAVKLTKHLLENGAVLTIYRGKESYGKKLKGYKTETIELDLKGIDFKRHFLFIKKGE